MHLIEVAFILGVCSVIQSTVGFAYGMFAIPPLVWIGLPLPHAIATVLAASLIQSAWASYQLRSDIVWSQVAVPMGLRLLMMPLGALVLLPISNLDRDATAQLIGVVLLVIVVVLWAWKVAPVERLGAGWTLLAFTCSGLMVGMFGMGAPPMVLWVMAHDWSSRRSRAFMLLNMVAIAPAQLLVLRALFGPDIWPAIVAGLACTPVVLAGAQFGLWLGHTLSKRWLKSIAYGLVMLLAVGSIATPLMTTEATPVDVGATLPQREAQANVE